MRDKECPVCGGKCCRDIDTKYRTAHMGAEVYEHCCDACRDGTDQRSKRSVAQEAMHRLATRPRDEILAQWDGLPAHQREACVMWLSKLRTHTGVLVQEASDNRLTALQSELIDSVIALGVAMDLLGSKGEP